MIEKKALILRACGHTDENNECESMKLLFESYHIKVDDYCPRSNEELIAYLGNGNSYDYIYLSSHGCEDSFGNEAKTVDLSWTNFGNALCESQCMNTDCIILLSCCRGGLNQVAYALFSTCNSISYVIGPRQSLTSQEMLISFSILLYNSEYRRMDSVIACKKIELATDIRFVCYDRLEVETDLSFLTFLSRPIP